MSDIFLSHSWKDKSFAFRLEADLGGQGMVVWVDHSELRSGQVLIDELQKAIEDARALSLLWSADASTSRWVKTEWQAAFVLEKTVIPCLLDDTELPLFLRTLLSCDFRASYEEGLAGLVEALTPGAKSAPAGAPPLTPTPAAAEAPLPRSSLPAKILSRGLRWLADRFPNRFGGPIAEGQPAQMEDDRSRRILEGQAEVLDALGRGDPEEATASQKRAGALLTEVVWRMAEDSELLNLAGYQKKNAYLIRHWADVQRGTFPPDPLLEEAEEFFHESLSAKPENPSAWNGLGSVFLLRGDLDAARFFVKKALERGRAQGLTYEAAEADLQTIARMKQARDS